MYILPHISTRADRAGKHNESVLNPVALSSSAITPCKIPPLFSFNSLQNTDPTQPLTSHDSAQLRFHSRRSSSYADPSLLSETEPLYRRTDGTMSYFFDSTQLDHLMRSAGHLQGSSEVVLRDMGNRKEGWTVQRRFVQGTFTKTA
jgi:hypothetical protein